MIASSSRRAAGKPIRHLMPARPTSTEPLTTPDVRLRKQHRPWDPVSPFPAYPSPQAKYESDAKHTHWLIKQLRSAIGLPADRQKTLKALGLHHRLEWTLQKFSHQTAGNILKVKELVQVKTCTREYGEMWIKRTKNMSEGSGLEVSGRAYGGKGGHQSTHI